MSTTTRFTRRALWGFVPLFVLGAAWALVGCPGAAPQFAVETTKDVAYGVGRVAADETPDVYTNENLLLDVYAPIGVDDVEKPALLLVHGGSFSDGSKEKEEIVEYANYFAARGFVAFSMDYRLTRDNPPAPSSWNTIGLTSAAHAAMVDVKAAVRFIRASAEVYGIDPDKIALLGESAGAIAAVPTAIADQGEFSQDRDDLPIQPENHPGVAEQVQTYIHFWGNADHVLLQVDSNDPPVMICHGKDDDRLGTRFETSERFARMLDLFNVPHVFYEARREGHGAWDYRNRGRNLKVLTLQFLEEHLLGQKALEAGVTE
ncbi:MAG: alpha/beta hydrolase [FCB group bacterium]|nr:alpha/beta hydrolase [FCB group bacterium]